MGEAHGVISQRSDQSAMDETASGAVLLPQPKRNVDGVVLRAPRPDRLPWIGERRAAKVRLEAWFGLLGVIAHACNPGLACTRHKGAVRRLPDQP